MKKNQNFWESPSRALNNANLYIFVAVWVSQIDGWLATLRLDSMLASAHPSHEFDLASLETLREVLGWFS